MTGFQVAGGDLRAHAAKAEAHGAKIGQAVDAAGQVMTDDAYGLICQFLPPLFNELEEAASAALKAAQGGLGETAENLRTAADRYESQDGVAKLKFDGFSGELE
ncbi:type VII secretion target [Amycolatopsis roodepoortensis]|uniref:ABC-type transporter Mla subunit MlaD n=1 Tax=Amycolatopsis roodepoortensis TaxID=700274 RepID=A0ABR9L8M0_9PSEU|nr:type VII secretion target [Amycolatopsis roodepoortensis]MBE1576966.1 ABC-type transporter Mla subunit MlaD [Amycolatopsis roodepoortensis]